MNTIAFSFFCHMLHTTVKVKINFILQLGKKLLQHNIIHIRAKVSDRSIQQMQVILDANLLKLCIAGWQYIRVPSPPWLILISSTYLISSMAFFFMNYSCSVPEFIGNVILPSENAPAAKTAHNGTGRTSYTRFLTVSPINRTFSLLKFSALLKNGNLQFRFLHGHSGLNKYRRDLRR